MPLDDTTNYWIARGQQMFGPYTGSQVREYVAAGNIVASDMIRGERDSEWVPVSASLGLPTPPAMPSYPPGYGQMPAPIAAADPGRTLALWSIGVSTFGLLCCSCASPVGLVLGVIALIKATPASKNLAWAGLIIGIIGLLLNIGFAILVTVRPELNPLNDLMKGLQQQ